MIEFSEQADADAAIKDLDGRRVEGSKERLRAHLGDLGKEGKLGSLHTCTLATTADFVYGSG